MPWVGLQFVIVVFPDHTHLPFEANFSPATKCYRCSYLHDQCNRTNTVLKQLKDYTKTNCSSAATKVGVEVLLFFTMYIGNQYCLQITVNKNKQNTISLIQKNYQNGRFYLA